MIDKEIHSIGLFFLLCILDDQRATVAATKATDLFYRSIKKNPQMPKAVILVSVTNQVWKLSKLNILRGRPRLQANSGWEFPQGLKLSLWMDFQKSASENELLISVWNRVLGISENDLSIALQISSGTVRYRVAKALRRLAHCGQSPLAKNPEVVHFI